MLGLNTDGVGFISRMPHYQLDQIHYSFEFQICHNFLNCISIQLIDLNLKLK